MRRLPLLMLTMILPAFANAAPPATPAAPATPQKVPATPPAQQAIPQPRKTVRMNPPSKLSAAESTTFVAQWNAAFKVYKADKDIKKLQKAGETLSPTGKPHWARLVSTLSKSPKAGQVTRPQLGRWDYVIESAAVTGYTLTMADCKLSVYLDITFQNVGSPFPTADAPPEIKVAPMWIAVWGEPERVNWYTGPKLMTGARHTMNVWVKPYEVDAIGGCNKATAQQMGFIDFKVGHPRGKWVVYWGGFDDPTISLGYDEPVPGLDFDWE